MNHTNKNGLTSRSTKAIAKQIIVNMNRLADEVGLKFFI